MGTSVEAVEGTFPWQQPRPLHQLPVVLLLLPAKLLMLLLLLPHLLLLLPDLLLLLLIEHLLLPELVDS